MAKYWVTCEWCGAVTMKILSPSHYQRQKPRFCNKHCSQSHRMSDPAYTALLHTEKQRAGARETLKRLQTQPEFEAKRKAALHNHLHGSTNPFRNPSETMLAKRHATLRAKGYKNLTGGNGQGPTEAQTLLASHLNWPTEVVIRTGRKNPWPPAYKVDIGCSATKIAIEVDGLSHTTTQGKIRDTKKDGLLNELGWTVLRYTNQQILTSLEEVVQDIQSTISKQQQETM